MKTTTNRLLFTLSFTALAMTACGGKNKAIKTDSAKAGGQQKQIDITRPPEFEIEGGSRVEVERDPSQSVSFDEWRKQQEQDKRKAQNTEDE